MGGPGQNIGSASIEISADLRPFETRMQRLARERIKEVEVDVTVRSEEFKAAMRQVFLTNKVTQENIRKEIEETAKAQENAIKKQRVAEERLGAQMAKDVERQIALEQKKAEAIAKQIQRRQQAEAKAAQVQIEQAQRAAAAQIRAQERAARQAQRRAEVEERAAARLAAKWDNYAKVLTKREINRAHEEALRFNAAFDRQNANIFKRFELAVSGADAKLQRFGLTSRDVAVIAGAGLAGGVAFAVRSMIDFGAQAVRLAAQLEGLRTVSDQIFGPVNEEIRNFAESAREQLGITERAALEATNRLGLAFKNLGFQLSDAALFSETLTTVAVALSRATGGLRTTQEALDAVIAAVTRSEFDPLEQFGVILNQNRIEAEAARLGIAEFGDELNQQQKTVAALNLVLQGSGEQLALFEELGEEGASQFEQFKAALEEIQTTIGENLLPQVTEVTKRFNDFLDILAKVGALNPFGDLVRDLQAMKREIDENIEGDSWLDRLLRANDPTKSPVGNIKGIIDALRGQESAVEDLAEEEDILLALERAIALANEDSADIRERLTAKIEDQIDAERRLNRAIADAERNVDRAEKDLRRTRLDGVRNVFRAERDLQRARRDAAQSIEDAEERVREARLEGFRDIRDARERLADFERESLRDVEDAEDELRQAQQRRLDNILDARLAIQRAQIAGDAEAENQARIELSRAAREQEVAEARERLEEERADRIRELKRLERELAETRVDVADEISDAQEELSRTIVRANERIIDAQEKVEDAFRESQEAIIRAEERLTDAIRNGEEAVFDARDAFNELTEEVNKLKKELKGAAAGAQELENNLDLTVPEYIEGYGFITGLTTNRGRKAGGPIYPGQSYVVGENGPELISPDQRSTVINNDQFMRALEALGGGAGNTFNIFEAVDPEATADAIANRLVQGVR